MGYDGTFLVTSKKKIIDNVKENKKNEIFSMIKLIFLKYI